MPAPPASALKLGGLELRLYPVCVLAGLLIWMLLTARLWERGGGDRIDALWTCVLAAPAALAGARLYSVLTDAYRGEGSSALDFGHGGLGIYGAVAGGMLALYAGARARGWPIGTFLDCAMPGLPLAQAVGRFGNYFNQELYGSPSTLPWALHVDPAYRPIGDETVATYHPTFLYEALYDVVVFGVLGLLWGPLTRRFHPGAVVASYLALYGFGRFFVEALRSDPAATIGPLRLNQVISLGVVATAFILLGLLDRRRDVRPGGR